jgi:hypothetical protein
LDLVVMLLEVPYYLEGQLGLLDLVVMLLEVP